VLPDDPADPDDDEPALPSAPEEPEEPVVPADAAELERLEVADAAPALAALRLEDRLLVRVLDPPLLLDVERVLAVLRLEVDEVRLPELSVEPMVVTSPVELAVAVTEEALVAVTVEALELDEAALLDAAPEMDALVAPTVAGPAVDEPLIEAAALDREDPPVAATDDAADDPAAVDALDDVDAGVPEQPRRNPRATSAVGRRFMMGVFYSRIALGSGDGRPGAAVGRASSDRPLAQRVARSRSLRARHKSSRSLR